MRVPESRGIVVLGGGLAGSSVALRLARAGRDVLLLERSAGPHHKVCGEFLSTEALHYLRGLGIDLERLGAVPIRRVRLASGERISEAPLPFPAMSLSRHSLDEALLQAAEAAGVEVRRGAHVQRLQQEGTGWKIELRSGLLGGPPGGPLGEQELRCADIFLATGKHDLRERPRPAGTHSGLVGMKMYFRLHPAQAAALEGAVELLLFPGGYAGLQSTEGGRANLCPLVAGSVLRQCGGDWAALLEHMLCHSPHLRERLQGAEPLLPSPLAIAPIPYGHVQKSTEGGLWRLGDQAAVIPSFSGDGMSIALHSAALAADRYLRGGKAAAFQQELAGQMHARIRLATTVSRMLVRHPRLLAAAHAVPAMLPWVASVTRIRAGSLLPAVGPVA